MTYKFNPPPLQIPDGRYASLEEMATFGSVLQDFVQKQEALLPEIDSSARHNQIVDFLTELANCYNEQLSIFKDAELSRSQRWLTEIMQLEII